jgi:antitoxin (DNA-binding transcriptional repressor) of toxin-antitoxin stability system
MFQQVIYDGLIGDSFLRNLAVTYDLPNSRMIFAA